MVYLINVGLIMVLYGISMICVNTFDKNKTYSQKNLYYMVHVPKLAVRDFGVLTEMRLDLQRTIFGFEEQIITNSNKTDEKRRSKRSKISQG